MTSVEIHDRIELCLAALRRSTRDSVRRVYRQRLTYWEGRRDGLSHVASLVRAGLSLDIAPQRKSQSEPT